MTSIVCAMHGTKSPDVIVVLDNGAITTVDGSDLWSDDTTVVAFREWLAGGGVIKPYCAVSAGQGFFARDLVEHFVPEDWITIDAATNERDADGKLTARSAELRTFLEALRVQGEEPINVGSTRFQTAWSALGDVLGTERTTAIAVALGIHT